MADIYHVSKKFEPFAIKCSWVGSFPTNMFGQYGLTNVIHNVVLDVYTGIA